MEVGTTLEMMRETAAYRLELVPMDQVSPDLMNKWRAFLENHSQGSPMLDPIWLQEHIATGNSQISVYFLLRGDSLAGFVPVLLSDSQVKCQLGEIGVRSFPVRRMTLLGSGGLFPEDNSAYEMLFRHLSAQKERFDALYLDNVPTDSFLWKFLETNPQVHKALTRYVPERPAARLLLHLEGSFESYMARFSSKHRQTLRRKVRKFQDLAPGETLPVCFTRPDQVEAFIEQAVEISRKTYQWQLLGQGLRDAAKLKRHLLFLAQHGWLRSYLLVCKGKPCAFVTGFQYGSRYYLDDIGFDPAWRDYSVGTVLQVGIIEDLFQNNRPKVYDLGEYGTHKEEFATLNYLQGKVFLFRPGVYGSLVKTAHRLCNASTAAVSSVVDRFGLKKRLKKLIRMSSSETSSGSPTQQQ